MSLSLYKPSKSNKGTAISFMASDNDNSLYLSLIKQASWNETTRTGSFIQNKDKPGLNAKVKLNHLEAACILDSIETNSMWSTVHSTEKKMTNITFAPGDEQHPGFTLSVNQTDKQDTTLKSSFFMPLSFGEARLIKEYLVHYLHKSFQKVVGKVQQQAPDAPTATLEGSTTQSGPENTQEAPRPENPENW